MKNYTGLILFVILPFLALSIMAYIDSNQHPYAEGWHMDYTIRYENGYVYKVLPGRQGVIQVLNRDGSPKTIEQVNNNK